MTVNFIQIQEKIKSEPDSIADIIGKLGYTNVRDKGAYFSAGNPDGDNTNALCVYKESLRYTNYTRGHEGNIFSLVMNDKHYSFPEALNWTAKVIGFVGTSLIVKYPFHSFYKNIIAEQRGEIPTLSEYSWSSLPDANCFSKKYLDDGVDVITQRDWGIRYSIDDDAILTPILDMNGKLVGCKARNNTDKDMSNRFYAYLPYQKNAIVYGACQNYSKIISKNTVIIAEAEKSVLQANSFGLNCVVGIAGHSVSNIQANIIKGLMCKNIIVAFDEGICEEEIRYEAKKLISDNILLKNNIYYLYDRDKKFIHNKQSPTDNGKKVFQKMLKECKYKL